MPRAERLEIPAPGTNQKIPIYGALNYRTNRVSYKVGYGKNAVEFLGFLAQLADEYGGRPCVVVLDNASYHTAVVVQKFLAEMSAQATRSALILAPALGVQGDVHDYQGQTILSGGDHG